MEMVLILIQQILVMMAMMAIGIALVKTKMINNDGVGQLSNIAMYVATARQDVHRGFGVL